MYTRVETPPPHLQVSIQLANANLPTLLLLLLLLLATYPSTPILSLSSAPTTASINAKNEECLGAKPTDIMALINVPMGVRCLCGTEYIDSLDNATEYLGCAYSNRDTILRQTVMFCNGGGTGGMTGLGRTFLLGMVRLLHSFPPRIQPPHPTPCREHA